MIATSSRGLNSVPAGNRRVRALTPSLISLLALALVCIYYTFDALRAPFFGGGDLTSNLLPIIHFWRSIAIERTLPWYTNLWYGGRYQWMNPLWSFFYIPSTVIWLLFPLDWAARIVIVGHFIGSTWAGRSLASLFLDSERDRFLAALLFASPGVIGIVGGQLEKVLSWPWVLLGLRFLLDTHAKELKTGFLSGLCLGVLALTGAMYYLFYSIVLLGLITLSRRSGRLTAGFLGGSSIGLLHLPSVWYLVGSPRDPVGLSVSLSEAAQALFIGFRDQAMSWEKFAESFAVVGAPIALLLIWSLCCLPRAFWRRDSRIYFLAAAGFAAALFLLLATGVAYRGHHFLDTFRTTSRAMAFVAVVTLLGGLAFARELRAKGRVHRTILTISLALSAIQVVAVWGQLRPAGLEYWIYSGADQVAQSLQSSGAKSVWIDVTNYRSSAGETGRLLGVALNLRGIALPDWYYGNMGQSTPLNGPFCGYPFDYLLSDQSFDLAQVVELAPNCYHCAGTIRLPRGALTLEGSYAVADRQYKVYRVVCA